MAYRVNSDSGDGAPKGASQRQRGDHAFTRNALIASIALGGVVLGASGAALFSNSHGFGSSADIAARNRSLRIAFADAALQAVKPDGLITTRTAQRSTSVGAIASIQTGDEARKRDRGTFERADEGAPVPLPVARPTITAFIPLPRARVVDNEPTGSLGNAVHEAAVASARPAREPILALVAPIRELPPPAKRHVLTAHEKLWAPVRLASLAPVDTFRDTGSGLPRAPYDRQTAVYVIADKKVYLPDGTALEAHSGLGEMMDDPRFVNVRMRGATPPHVYDLTMREQLFHGVEAIRLTPIRGEDAIFGRDGLLAHSYMLGPRGDSNGCVSFRDYDAFLDAFKDGKISRLAVIARLD